RGRGIDGGVAVDVAAGAGRRDDHPAFVIAATYVVHVQRGRRGCITVLDGLRHDDRRDGGGHTGVGPGPGGTTGTTAQGLEDLGHLGLVERLAVHQGEHQGVEDV